MVNRIYRLEDLSVDPTPLCRDLGFDFVLPKKNHTDHLQTPKLSQGDKTLIFERYRQDFELFDYKMA